MLRLYRLCKKVDSLAHLPTMENCSMGEVLIFFFVILDVFHGHDQQILVCVMIFAQNMPTMLFAQGEVQICSVRYCH